MSELAECADTERAETARANLLRDIRAIKKIGNQMAEKTETAIHRAPLLLGLGAAGVALVGVAMFASRRKPAPLFGGRPRERSFLAEATRAAALSALGILSGRLTQHLLESALPAPVVAPLSAPAE